ncbi:MULTISPECIES: excinuclease ABC subunit UvrB [unclassified Nitratiruptor]|uniref:excinuclease ABC subunit UvrB n=1 Tax=unclassified Nitratiruptor TaxID=2624044 RepID=UPI001938D3E8|nr:MULTISPECIES: excinuclease ABC subunit UvrB [unclassified Nitratiruptor]BCD59664.1 excinuclease ABC subunit B [Nitratiruptor sp. YY08-10]BCD63588.1 excinuclease ABC subunit B [Nitratiruptor sp. YY08-14]
MAKFEMTTPYPPAGDQPQAIEKLSLSIKEGNRYQTLLGVTGSGKTYTMAKIIEKLQMPTLIMTHNKTLAAQLFSEFKHFFPKNHVEYFISYYDYYQPEAYLPRQDLFIEKDSSINEELERLRLSATASLLEYDDVIVVASVSANYGLGNPNEYRKMVFKFEVGNEIGQRELLFRLLEMGYKRNDKFFDRGDFRVSGDVVDIYPAYFEDEAIRVEFFGDEIESIYYFDPLTNKKLQELQTITLYAANQFIVGQNRLAEAIKSIEKELEERLNYFLQENKLVEYQRLKQRTEFDLEMLETTGTCKGIENYSRHLTGKKPGKTPYSLIDYFEAKGKPYLIIVDESHVSLPQFRGMYAGDRSRKEVLVEYGFRLPSALDNRPLKFDEFINKAPHYLFVSATPGELELELSSVVAEQIIRPTGLLDPLVELAPSRHQVEILHDEIKKETAKGNKVLVTTLTKKMAEDLSKYYADLGIKVRYMHSEIDAIERNQLIRGLRRGEFDVLIGINLLREGLDLPEVSLVAILDADKEGFLRSETSLIQTMGRAARNAEGRVVMFADKIEQRTVLHNLEDLNAVEDKITGSMQRAIKTTIERRLKQDAFNKAHGIIPKTVHRRLDENLKSEDLDKLYEKRKKMDKLPAKEKEKIIKELRKAMHEAAKRLEFEEAARLRDETEKIKAL